MDPQQLPSYKYCPFQDAGRDIRIVELLPGQFHDSLRVQIHHAPLVEPPDVADTRMTIPQLQETLPKGWDVLSNPEGKYLFRFWIDDKIELSWEHPDPSVDKAAYELPTYHDELDPHYEALSYVWGSDQKPHHLMVEGEQGCTQIAITDGLMSALRHLRRPNEPRRLWVDAVCINQDDPVEVASQVQRMGLVYKLAYRVVVWLGSQSEGSAHALATLDLIGAQVEIDRDDDSLWPAPFAEHPTWYVPISEFSSSRHASLPTWDAVTELLRRPWFTRVWTVQAPSWVPDWGSHAAAPSPHNRQFATGASRAHFRYSDEEPDLLEVLGMSCAVVSHVDGPIPKRLGRLDAVDRVRQWQPRDLDTATYKPTGEPLRKAYACTLIEDYAKERFNALQCPTIEKWVEQAGYYNLFGDFRPPGEYGDTVKMNRAIRRALVYCDNYAFIQTHEGYIGLAQPETMPGDVVAIFLGCSNPLVLRPEKGRYSVVGESFIYGLGDAIKLLGPMPEPLRVMAKTTLGREALAFYFDPRTGETSWEDLRLEPLHGWERIDRDPDGDDPIDVDFFKHGETDIVVNYDPRLEPEMLEKRGVQLEWFSLM